MKQKTKQKSKWDNIKRLGGVGLIILILIAGVTLQVTQCVNMVNVIQLSGPYGSFPTTTTKAYANANVKIKNLVSLSADNSSTNKIAYNETAQIYVLNSSTSTVIVTWKNEKEGYTVTTRNAEPSDYELNGYYVYWQRRRRGGRYGYYTKVRTRHNVTVKLTVGIIGE